MAQLVKCHASLGTSVQTPDSIIKTKQRGLEVPTGNPCVGKKETRDSLSGSLAIEPTQTNETFMCISVCPTPIPKCKVGMYKR